MKLAVHYAQIHQPAGPASIGPTLAATARAADQGGIDTLTLMDHYFQMEMLGGPEQPMLEGYTSLGFVAGQTERIKLGLLVTGVTYRVPGLLAKVVATLDVLSGGRAFLGLGAAWYERESAGLGVPFPSTSERFELLEETLQVCRQMWSAEDGPYDGKHLHLAETVCVPQPLGPVPVLVGGSGEKKTLRLVAQYADACNLFDAGVDGLRHKIEVLHRHCEDVGRDPAEVAITVIGQHDPLADVDAFLSTMQEYAALGVEQVWVGPRGDDPAGYVARLGEQVVERLSEVSA